MSYISAKLDRKTNKVLVWHSENHVTTCKRYPGIYEFYIADKDGEYVSVFNEKLKKYSFDSYYEFEEAKKFLIDEKRIKLYESDIDIEFKVLSKLYYKQPAPKLNITMYDIEVDYNPLIGFSSPLNPYAPVNAISLHHYWLGESYVLAVPPPGFDMNDFDESLRDLSKVEFFKNERSLLLRFLDLIEDTTLITGWNSNGFDDPYICKRINQILGPRALKRMSFPDAPIPRFRETLVRNRTQCFVDIYGRVSVDYLEIFKKYEFKERPSYKLEAIADEFLPHLPKLSYTGTLASLYHNDFNHFIRYNVRDTEILKGFEDKLGYMALANEMCHSSCGLFTHIHGTVKLVDYAIINYCHNELNVKVPDRWDTADGSIQGAYVLLPQQGMHEHIGSIDISSLYPSAIIAINISPETYIGQFENNINDWETLYARREEELTLFLADGSTISKTTSEWVGYMLNKKWAVSGYGTVYDQTNPGIIPTILSNWYVERKEFQKLKLQYHDEASANPTQYDGLIEKSNYYDRLQFVTKIRLNSTYGALTNYNFRFFKLEAGESVTGTGRMILRHQCRKVSELLGGSYDINFPLYETVKECIDHNTSINLALHGPVFKGEFPSDSIIYSDTDSVYFKTYATNNEEAIKTADAVAEVVNKSFPAFMREAFLCQPGYDQKIKTAREIVSDRGIFVDKKRYMLHIIDSEGHAVDKLKIMGLELKKTTLPKPVQQTLTKFIERLLKGATWDSIAAEVVAYKKELINTQDILSIGLPKGVNNVENYTVSYECDRTCRLPGHVAAAIYYNIQLKEHEDHESPVITSGTKLKVFYLKSKFGKFKSIALPTDIDTVPSWFYEYFLPILDRDAQLYRLVDKPLEHILNAINEEVPTAQLFHVKELFTF